MAGSVFLALAFAVAYAVKRRDERRLGFAARPGYAWVGIGALAGALIGAKLGTLLYQPPAAWWASVQSGEILSFDGKSVLGGLAGGWLGVELVKRWVGLTGSTGDAYAVAIPLGQAVGRLGCWIGGCCYGAVTEVPWAIERGGELRHPYPLYELVVDLAIAAGVALLRARRPLPSGVLFRTSILAYAVARILLEPLRGDSPIALGGVPLPVFYCAAAALAIAWSIRSTMAAVGARDAR